MKKHAVFMIILAIIIFTLAAAVLKNGVTKIDVINFETCVFAGHPVMESFPRQCRDPVTNKTFTENITLCSPESRDPNMLCTQVYEPVCGLPIKETFSNGCTACLNEVVEYYVEGECQ